jgi:hypothetical protein
MTIRKIDVCTASLALAMALNPWTIAQAASHCKGLTDTVCGSTAACKWQAERKVGDKTKAGNPAKTGARAHCRLDVRAAAEIAAKIAKGQ